MELLAWDTAHRYEAGVHLCVCVCGVGYHPSIVIVAPIVASVVVVMDDVVRIVVVAGSKNTT